MTSRTSYQIANLHWKSWFSKWQKHPKIWLKFWNILHIKKKKKSEEWHKTFRMLFFFSLQTPKLPVNKKNKKKLKYVWNGILICISHHGINFNFLCEYTLDRSQVLCTPTPREAKQCGVTWPACERQSGSGIYGYNIINYLHHCPKIMIRFSI